MLSNTTVPPLVVMLVKPSKFASAAGAVVFPVPPLASGSVPVTPLERGKPVTLVITPLAGVPRAGVTSVGLVDKTVLPVPVDDVTPVPPFATAKVPAKVTAPEVAVDGVRPVVPPENVFTVTISPIRACTNAVFAICVVFVLLGAVGASGVPVKVGLFDITTEPVPVFVLNSAKPASQSAAVVSVMPMQVHVTAVPKGTVITEKPPDERTDTLPVALLTIVNFQPVCKVLVTGN